MSDEGLSLNLSLRQQAETQGELQQHNVSPELSPEQHAMWQQLELQTCSMILRLFHMLSGM